MLSATRTPEREWNHQAVKRNDTEPKGSRADEVTESGCSDQPVNQRHHSHEKQSGNHPRQKRYVHSRHAGSITQTPRLTNICLISPMALAGLRPFGQALAQFMIVWQR